MFLPGQFDSRTEERTAAQEVRQAGVRYAVVSRRRFIGYGHQRFGFDYDRTFASALLRNRIAIFSTPGVTPGGTTPSHTYSIYRIDGSAGRATATTGSRRVP
jgi:hypothetical protein